MDWEVIIPKYGPVGILLKEPDMRFQVIRAAN